MFLLPDPTDLFWLFECEPELLDDDVPQRYNTLTYRTRRGDNEVVCSLTPSYGDVEVLWKRNGEEVARVALVAASEVRVRRDGLKEIFEVSLDQPDRLTFRLQLKPIVQVSLNVEGRRGISARYHSG